MHFLGGVNEKDEFNRTTNVCIRQSSSPQSIDSSILQFDENTRDKKQKSKQTSVNFELIISDTSDVSVYLNWTHTQKKKQQIALLSFHLPTNIFICQKYI